MFRVRDPVASLDFYQRILGMTYVCARDARLRGVACRGRPLSPPAPCTRRHRAADRLIHEMPMEAGKFTNYFLGYVDKAAIPTDPAELHRFMTSQPGVLELCQYAAVAARG